MKKEDVVAGNRFMFDEKNLNPFSLFGIPVSVFINRSDIDNKYQEILLQMHPDNFVSEDRFMKESAEKLSAIANEYYSILKDPLKRCKAAIAAKEWKSLDNNTINDVDFLTEMMDLQEIANSGESVKVYYDDAFSKLEIAIQNNDEINGLNAFNKISFLSRFVKD